MSQNIPHAVIVTVFNDICAFLLETEDDLESVRRNLDTQLGRYACFLRGCIPNVESLLDVDEVYLIAASKVQSFPHLQGACRRLLLNAITSYS
jgi:hypothetical protein